MEEYPMLEKMRQVEEKSRICGEFLISFRVSMPCFLNLYKESNLVLWEPVTISIQKIC